MAARGHREGGRAARDRRRGRGLPGGGRGGERGRRAGCQDNRRADGHVRRPGRAVLAPRRRGDRPPGRAVHGHLHIRLPAPVLHVPRRGRDGRPVRPRHRAGDPGDGHQGRLPEVRRRRAGRHAQRREGAPRHRSRERAHRCSDHGPLAPGLGDRAAPGRGLRGRGRRPLEGADRPHRRHGRPRLHRAAARQGRLHRDGPLRAGDLPAHAAAQRNRHGAARARLRRSHVPVPGLLRDA
jgi:hypothetical protein